MVAHPEWDTFAAETSHRGLSGCKDLDPREIASITGRIAGEQSQAPDGGVGTDVEIRQRRSPRAPKAAVSKETLPGQETGFPR
jgi:hypothetical protein